MDVQTPTHHRSRQGSRPPAVKTLQQILIRPGGLGWVWMVLDLNVPVKYGTTPRWRDSRLAAKRARDEYRRSTGQKK